MRNIRHLNQPSGVAAMEFRTQTVARQLVVTLLAMLALTEGVWSVAQTQATGQTPASSRSVLLREGTEIKLKLHDKITSKTAVEGDLVNFILDQDVKVGDITVARAGSLAVATVSHAAKPGMLGRPGDLGLRLEYLRADDSSVSCAARKASKERAKRGQRLHSPFFLDPSG
jgi:hypothetical protein